MQGATVWLTGLSGAGKTTIAAALAHQLRQNGRAVEVLDGDSLRRRLSPDLGFSKQDKDVHVARVGYVASLLARNGVLVVVAVIAPAAAARESVRAEHSRDGTEFVEVYVAAPVAVCAGRDVKGLYAAYRAGTVAQLSGLDAPYDVPTSADLVLETTAQTVDESVAALSALLVARGVA